jgi:exodeoxyribonuclease VII large subunit
VLKTRECTVAEAFSSREGLAGSAREGGVRIWPVGSLLRAIADSLEARFNPVAVQGELTGFSRAWSGNC